MKNLTRRDLCSAVPALGLLEGVFGDSAFARGFTTETVPTLPVQSEAFPFDRLPVSHSANGGAFRPVLHGRLPTGEVIELHETTLMPGQIPHPPHKHVHSELMMIREGSVEFEMDDRREVLGPGGVAYAASNTMHGLKNVGSVPANYFVIAIGVEG
jgi:mannose-6-phosphate isomerase-like protein (cupin superfamily)